MATFQDLVVWQKSMLLVEEVYRLVRFLPKEKLYSLQASISEAELR